jgi:hypothetical protein
METVKANLSIDVILSSRFLIKKIGTEFVKPNVTKKFKAMRPFEIKFDFPVASSKLKISLNATAELHHSEPYYRVRNFSLTKGEKNNDYHSLLPDQEIKRIKRNGSYVWVHKDSERESDLSIAIGAGIETVFSTQELNKD